MSACVTTVRVNGQTPGSGTPVVPGAPGWQVAAEVDFRDFNVAAIPDSPVATTLDGVDYFGFNAAVSTTWRIALGTGLQFTALAVGGNTQWNDTTQNATNLRVQMSSFIPNYDPARRYLFQLLLGANNADAASEKICFSIIRPANTPTGATALAMGWTFSGHNTTAVMGGFGSSNSAGTGSVDYTFANGYDTLSIASSPGSASGLQGYVAIGAGAWPAQTAQRPVTSNQLTGTPTAITAAEFVDPRCLLAISFPTGNSSGTFSGTVLGMRALVA